MVAFVVLQAAQEVFFFNNARVVYALVIVVLRASKVRQIAAATSRRLSFPRLLYVLSDGPLLHRCCLLTMRDGWTSMCYHGYCWQT